MQTGKNALMALAACVMLACSVIVAGCSSGGSSVDSGSNGDASASTASSAEANTSGDHETLELQVFAANSLSKAMEEAQALYVQQNPDIAFADTQYKSSGELNELLAGGAEADILISASANKMDDAETKKYVDPTTRFDLFNNDLVMVTAEGNEDITTLTLEDVASGKYTVAVGDDSVPAGNYANQVLSTVGCFVDPEGKTGRDSAGKANGTAAYAETPLAGKVVTDTSVGNVCKKAESGDADIAFVYASDVYRFGGVKIVGTVPADTHKAIVYPATVVAKTENAQAAQAFLDWCNTDADALEIWQKWGFEMAS